MWHAILGVMAESKLYWVNISSFAGLEDIVEGMPNILGHLI